MAAPAGSAEQAAPPLRRAAATARRRRVVIAADAPRRRHQQPKALVFSTLFSSQTTTATSPLACDNVAFPGLPAGTGYCVFTQLRGFRRASTREEHVLRVPHSAERGSLRQALRLFGSASPSLSMCFQLGLSSEDERPRTCTARGRLRYGEVVPSRPSRGESTTWPTRGFAARSSRAV